MTDAVLIDPRPRRRGPWSPGPADGPPSCPGCGRPIQLHQPDPARPDDLLRCCTATTCDEWLILRRREARLCVAERIPRERRRAPIPPRPAAIGAAG